MPSTPTAGTPFLKSPKTPRRVKTPELRQVHFEAEDADEDEDTVTGTGIWGGTTHGFTTANSPSGGFSGNISSGKSSSARTGILKNGSPRSSDKGDPTPSSFPQVGPAPTSHLQLHTAANPSLSLNHQPTNTYSYGGQQHQQFLVNPSRIPPQASFTQHTTPITYIGLNPTPQPPRPQANMGDYQNAVPPVHGLHFQPPVPDTTFGPIPHVYVPRFDGGLAPGVQQPNVAHMAPQPAHNGYVVAQQPYLVQQPVMGQQPVMMNQQPQFMPQAQHMAGMPMAGLAGGAAVNGGYPVYPGNNGHIPEITGMGRTEGEEQLRQIKFAHENRLYEPQDFKPADDDPSRYYYVREVDGHWTQRNRFTIDHLGDCRWYVTNDGWFYAIRMPS
ncbi:hypothetical protein QQX98_006150 [Neonectria punicea]|uniref:Uncharacterized protein n=1 Tax=Neonectria punicea TaxID=979145 RepID=A0ABR1H1Y1_9HYPO